MIALFALSIFAISLSAIPHGIYTQTGSEVNNPASFRGNFSSQEEKQKVQRDLADLMRKAISMGAEIPEISGFDENNATLYVKVNVNNTGEKIANASDFYFTINYQSEPGNAGVAVVYGSDAGVIVRLPESTYGLMSQRSETGDPEKDSFINSFGLSSYTKDCYGKIRAGESKECTVTKSISTPSNNTSNGTNSASQVLQIPENDTNFQSPLSVESPSFKPVEGTYVNNQSGIQVTFPPDFESSLGIASPEFPDVNGTYVNPEVGLQIDLPAGWTGKEISFIMNSVIASPEGVDLESIEEPGTAMTIQMINQETVNELANLAQSFGFEGAGNESQMASDPLAIGGVEGEQCEELPASFVTINGIKAEQRSASCSDEEGTASKIRAYTFATADDTIILLALVSNSTSEYDQYLPLFEESVKTVKISEPGDIATSELYRKHKEMERQQNNNITMG